MSEVVGGAETTTVQEGAPAAAGAPEAAGPDIDGMLLERFGAFEQQIGGMLDQRFAAMQPQEPEADPFSDALQGVYDDPAERQDVAQALQGLLGPLVQQALAPALSKIEALESSLDAGDLEARYPNVQEAEWTKAMEGAEQMAQRLGMDPAKGRMNPALIEASLAIAALQQRGAAEVPAGGQPVALEQAGGASPGEPEPTPGQRILAANGPASPGRSLWGW